MRKKNFINRRNMSVLIKAQVLDKAGSAKVLGRYSFAISSEIMADKEI